MPSEGMVRVGPLMALPTMLERLGGDAGALLAEFGLEPMFFDDSENTLDMVTVGRILGRCVERTGCAHFGLLVGQRASLSALGAVGFLMQSSANVGAALDLLARHLNTQDRAAIASIESDGHLVTMSYAIVQPGVGFRDQVLAASAAIGLNILRGMCGQQWTPNEVLLAFTRPANVEPYRRFFGMLPRFDTERSALVFPAAVLDRPLPSADPLLHRMMAERVRELQLRAGADLVDQVRRMLRIMITSADCSLDAVSRRLGVHRRTLNRDLASEGASFFQLREEVRYEAACQLLEGTRTPACDIASILGYTSAGSFTRAFKRWSGMGPAQWRASRRRHPLGRP